MIQFSYGSSTSRKEIFHALWPQWILNMKTNWESVFIVSMPCLNVGSRHLLSMPLWEWMCNVMMHLYMTCFDSIVFPHMHIFTHWKQPACFIPALRRIPKWHNIFSQRDNMCIVYVGSYKEGKHIWPNIECKDGYWVVCTGGRGDNAAWRFILSSYAACAEIHEADW